MDYLLCHRLQVLLYSLLWREIIHFYRCGTQVASEEMITQSCSCSVHTTHTPLWLWTWKTNAWHGVAVPVPQTGALPHSGFAFRRFHLCWGLFRDNCISTASRKLAVQRQAAPASLWAGLWWIEAQSQVRFSQCMHPLRRQLVLLLPSAWERECILSAEQHSCSLHHVTAIQKAFSETFRSKWRRGWPLSWMDENGMFSFPIGFEPSKY